jgi:streptogramin lyase
MTSTPGRARFGTTSAAPGSATPAPTTPSSRATPRRPYSDLSYALGDFSVDVDVNNLQDGGIWLRSSFDSGSESGLLLVTGGFGGSGTGLYWHTVQSGSYSGTLNPVAGLFAPIDAPKGASSSFCPGKSNSNAVWARASRPTRFSGASLRGTWTG